MNNNFHDIIRQLQTAIELSTRDNVELRQQIMLIEDSMNPNKEKKVSELQKILINQQQQIAQLKQDITQNSKIKKDHYNKEDDKYLIEQLKTKIDDKSIELNQQIKLYEQLQWNAKQMQEDILDLKDRINKQCQLNAEEQQKVTKLELLMKNARDQESISIQYILEIERLNSQIQQLEYEQKGQSRITQ